MTTPNAAYADTKDNISVTDYRRISNSEVTAWLTCRNQYRYAYDLKLQPKIYSSALNKGNLVHGALEQYYKAQMDGHPESVRVLEGERYLTLQLSKNGSMEDVQEAYRIYTGYVNYHAEADAGKWEILGVEQSFDLPINDTYSMPLKFDLLVKALDGRFAGKTGLIDHKTTYDFWSDDDHALNPQFPKYMGSLRANGIPVEFCVLNEIRTRRLKNPGPSDLFKRTVYATSKAKIRNALQQQIFASEEITAYRALPDEVRPFRAIPVFNKHGGCKFCNFKPLCESEYDGGSIEHLIKTDYEPNTYGYNNTPQEMVGEM